MLLSVPRRELTTLGGHCEISALRTRQRRRRRERNEKERESEKLKERRGDCERERVFKGKVQI
jgi:hypothetical protein